MIPNTITKLSLLGTFNQPIKVGVLPESLLELTIGNEFNQYLPPHSLPNGLKYLKIGMVFDQTIPMNLFPDSLETLIFQSNFNKPLTIMPGLQHVLPRNLKTLILGSMFNQPLYPNTFPSTLKNLILSDFLNQPVGIDILPKGLELLEFGMLYNHILLPGVIPPTVTTLRMRPHSYELLKGVIPESVTTLELLNLNSITVHPDSIPHTVKEVVMSNYGNGNPKLNKNLESLSFVHFPKIDSKFIDFNTITDLDVSQPSIDDFYESVHLPPTLKRLKLPNIPTIQKSIPIGFLPESLEYLEFNETFSQRLDFLPQNINHIKFRGPIINFECPITNRLVCLDFGDGFNEDIPVGFISDTEIKCLKFGYHYDRTLDQECIPIQSLESIHFSSSCNQRFNLNSDFQFNTNNISFDIHLYAKHTFETAFQLKLVKLFIKKRVSFNLSTNFCSLSIRFYNNQYVFISSDKLEGGFYPISKLNEKSWIINYKKN